MAVDDSLTLKSRINIQAGDLVNINFASDNFIWLFLNFSAAMEVSGLYNFSLRLNTAIGTHPRKS